MIDPSYLTLLDVVDDKSLSWTGNSLHQGVHISVALLV